jgi:hypothetical protein
MRYTHKKIACVSALQQEDSMASINFKNVSYLEEALKILLKRLSDP